jgi:uncharacterized protein YceK
MTLDTQLNEAYDGPQVYSGVRKDLEIMGPAFLNLSLGWVVITLFDLPFSFVADTVLLPVTIPRESGRSVERAERLQVETDRPALAHASPGEPPLDGARRLFDACRERLRRQEEGFSDCYAVDARVSLAGGQVLRGADYKRVVRQALSRQQATGVFVDWRDPVYALEGERVRVRASRRSTGEPAESALELVVARGSDGGWRIVEETSVGFPER